MEDQSAVSEKVSRVRSTFRRYGESWSAWRGASTNRRIFAAASSVAIATLIVKIVSTAKDVSVARYFGRGDLLDCFLIAYVLPAFVINVIAGSFNAALIPTLIRVQVEEGQEAASRLASSVVVCGVALLVAVSICMGLASPALLALIGSGFSPEKLALTKHLFWWLLIVPPLSGITQIRIGMLNASERFALPALIPAITPIVMVVAILGLSAQLSVEALVAGVLAGSVFEIILSTLLAKAHTPFGVAIRWNGYRPGVGLVARQYLPMVAASILMSSTAVVDQAMATRLGSGSVSALNYANKIPAAILGLSAMSLGSAVMPHFARMVANGDWAELRRTVNHYLSLILLIAVPGTVLAMLASQPLVRILFQRGAFTAADTALVAGVQSAYFAQTPFYIAGILLVRLISALKRNDILFWGTIISVILNVALDLILMRIYGVAGIAMSTAVVYLVSFIFLYAAWHRWWSSSARSERIDR